MSDDDRRAIRGELRAIRRWLVIIAILLAGILFGMGANLNALPDPIGIPLFMGALALLVGGPVYLVTSLLLRPPGTDNRL